MSATDSRKRFRRYLAQPTCLQPASVFDPTSARIADLLGHEIGMLGGSIASAVILGAPDITLITITELADLVKRITRVSRLSLMVDADHGYGNALNVMCTVRELEASGLSALTIEDTDLPAHFGVPQVKKLISIPEMVGKLKAAVNARTDPSLVIIGRTDALATEGLDPTVERIRAYSTSGVDAIFLVDVESRQELEKLCAATSLPLILGTASPALEDTEYLVSVGVRIKQKGHATFKAVYEVLHSQRQSATAEALSEAQDLSKLIADILDQDAYAKRRDEFLTTQDR